MEIDINQFKKLDLKVGLIKTCDLVPKTKNLYKLMVDCGEETQRQILTGIASYYSPADLINQKIVVLTNLKPKVIFGLESQGMILAADVNNEPFLLKIDQKRGKQVPPGSTIK